MPELKIRIDNPHHGNLAQKYLFTLGAKWGGKKPYRIRKLLSNTTLYVSQMKRLYVSKEVVSKPSIDFYLPSIEELEWYVSGAESVVKLMEYRPIAAIKEVRRYSGLGLKEANDLVDNLREHIRICKEAAVPLPIAYVVPLKELRKLNAR